MQAEMDIGTDKKALQITKLQSGDGGWERMVPPEVVQIIKEREFFGYQAPVAA